MRIIMLNHFPLEGSGSGTYTKNLALQLLKRGHEVCVIFPENNPDYARYEGLRTHPVFFINPANAACAHKQALDFNFPCFTTHPASSTTFADLTEDELQQYKQAFSQALQEEIRDFQPDLIHGQHIWILPSLALDCGVPLVVTVHGTDLMGYEKWPDLRHYADTALTACKRLICVSKDNEELLNTRFPQYRSCLRRMRNGYNPDIFYPQDLVRSEVFGSYALRFGEPSKQAGDQLTPAGVIVFAGKMAHFKGIDVLLNAAARYEKELPGVMTVLAGDGEERAEREAQARQLGLERTHFIGNVTQDELARLYNCADLSVVPSRREPFGLVAVEAMACGTPVVASNEGGLPDFVNDEVGALATPEDEKDLAGKIIHVFRRATANPTWRDDIARYASTSYSQAVIMQELEDLYRDVLNKAEE